MSLQPPPQPESQEERALIEVPEYLGFALSNIAPKGEPEIPQHSWFVLQVSGEDGKPKWYVTDTVFTNNEIKTYWYDYDAFVAMVMNAQRVGAVLEQKMATSGGISVATTDQLAQVLDNMEKSKRNLLGKPGN